VGGKLSLASNHNLALPLVPYDLTNYIAANERGFPVVRSLVHHGRLVERAIAFWSLRTFDVDIETMWLEIGMLHWAASQVRAKSTVKKGVSPVSLK
jgi:hypothetical protein